MLLTSTGDVAGPKKKYFEDLLNPTNTSSIEDAEPVDFEVDSSITGANLKKLYGGRAPGVDKIRPKFLKM